MKLLPQCTAASSCNSLMKHGDFVDDGIQIFLIVPGKLFAWSNTRPHGEKTTQWVEGRARKSRDPHDRRHHRAKERDRTSPQRSGLAIVDPSPMNRYGIIR